MTSVLLSFNGLQKSFGGLHVLAGTSATVRAGEVVLVDGGNGAGKTTLLNILGGALPADGGEIRFADGTGCRYPEPRWRRALALPALRPETVARHGIGRVWQDVRLFGSLDLVGNLVVADPSHPGESLRTNLLQGEAVRHHEQSLQDQAHDTLTALGLAGRQHAGALQISLGQSKRVAMARARTAQATLLLLDEPLAGLDDAGRTQLVADLQHEVASRGLALVIVEHASNRAPLRPLVTTRWHLEQGGLQAGAVGTGDDNRQHADSDPFAGLLATLCALAPPRYQRQITLPGGALLHVLGQRQADGTPALAVSGLRVFRNEQQPVAGGEGGESICFELYDGETAVLRAPNGWGKTSLFEAIAGVIPLHKGTIHLAGDAAGEADATRLPVHARRRAGLAFLQSRDQGFPGLSVHEALALSGLPTPALLQPLASRRVANLSGGERQLLALLGVLLPRDARVRLLDEPFTGLDPGIQSAVLRTHWRGDGVNLISLPGNG